MIVRRIILNFIQREVETKDLDDAKLLTNELYELLEQVL